MPDDTTIHHTDLRTSDRHLAAEATTAIAPHRPRLIITDPVAVEYRLSSATSGDFGAFRVRIRGMHYIAEADPLPFLFGGVLTGGNAQIGTRREQAALGHGDGFLYPVSEQFGCDFPGVDLALIAVPLDLAAQIAEESTGLLAANLRFESLTPVSEPMRRHWAATITYLGRQLGSAHELPELIVAELRRLAATSMLAVFPNTTMTMARTPAGGQVAPAALRRATAHIDAHPQLPLTVAEISAAAGVGPRALQEAFRRHLGTTPMAYLRRVRLERVHHELLAADPAVTTVSDVAYGWGFGNLGRFAADYRAAFGQLPSHTLRT
jgi:AraC-like DNA-binding protein